MEAYDEIDVIDEVPQTKIGRSDAIGE